MEVPLRAAAALACAALARAAAAVAAVVRLCECMLRCLPPFSRIVAVPPAFAHHAPSLTLKTSSTRAVETAEAIISNDSPPPIIKASSTLAVSTAKAIMFNTSPLPRLKHRWRWQPRRDDGQGPKVSTALLPRRCFLDAGPTATQQAHGKTPRARQAMLNRARLPPQERLPPQAMMVNRAALTSSSQTSSSRTRTRSTGGDDMCAQQPAIGWT